MQSSLRAARAAPCAARRAPAARRAAAPAYTLAPPRPRATTVRVAAFRDAHREEMIVKMGTGLVNAMMRGVRDGPDTVRGMLAEKLDGRVRYRALEPAGAAEGEGPEFLAARLAEERSRMDLMSWRIVAAAACPVDDAFFALVEMRFSPHGAKDAQPCVAYRAIECDVLFDDTALRALSVTERGQGLPAGMTSCMPVPFPEDHVAPYPKGLDEEEVMRNFRALATARASGAPEGQLDAALDPAFRLWDAASVQASPEASALRADEVKAMMAEAKERYMIEIRQLEAAVAHDRTVGFSRWREIATPKGGEGAAVAVDGLEVDVFGPDGRIKDAWLFRGPVPGPQMMPLAA